MLCTCSPVLLNVHNVIPYLYTTNMFDESVSNNFNVNKPVKQVTLPKLIYTFTYHRYMHLDLGQHKIVAT